MSVRRSLHARVTAQKGAALVMAAIMLTTILAFAALVANRSSQNELRGAYQASDALQALLSAETGFQRAAKRFALAGGLAANCTATGAGTVGETTYTYPTGVTITPVGKSSDFAGAALSSPTTQCRIEVTATVTASNVTRKVAGIVDTRIFNFTNANLDFNTGTPPTNWTLSGTGVGTAANSPYYRSFGASPGCTTSAWLSKTNDPGTVTGTMPVRFNLYKPSPSAAITSTLRADYRYVQNSGGADNNAANSLGFTFIDSAATSYAISGTVGAPTVQAITYTCGTGPAYTTSQSRLITLSIAQVTALQNPITTLQFDLAARDSPNNVAKMIDLDNITFPTPPAIASGGTYMRVLQWRECVPSPSNCP